jgi:ABC-type iron transport system FetAB permease component
MTLQDNPEARPVPSRHLTELIGRALLDRELRDRLFADPEAIARAFDLAATEAQATRLLDRRAFEVAIARLRWG